MSYPQVKYVNKEINAPWIGDVFNVKGVKWAVVIIQERESDGEIFVRIRNLENKSTLSMNYNDMLTFISSDKKIVTKRK